MKEYRKKILEDIKNYIILYNNGATFNKTFKNTTYNKIEQLTFFRNNRNSMTPSNHGWNSNPADGSDLNKNKRIQNKININLTYSSGSNEVTK